MQNNNNLPNGFITAEEAIKLINSDTKENPVVDIDYMVAHTRWLETGKNFRIPKIRLLAPEERKRDVRGNIHIIEKTGDVYVEVKSDYEREAIRKALNDKYYEMTNKEYAELKTRGVSTVADDAEGRNAVAPRANTPNTKAGDAIGGGSTVTTNGQGLTV